MNAYGTPGDLLTAHCIGAREIVVAAPYIKADALARVLSRTNSPASLVCVTRWNVRDLILGVSDIECRAIVVERGGSFRLCQNLHAKYYCIDGIAFIGSANCTMAAMGWSAQPNTEILCRPGDDFNAPDFQQFLLSNSRDVTDAEFAYWQSIAQGIEMNESGSLSQDPILTDWRPATRDAQHLELVYGGREGLVASYDEQRAARRDIQSLLIPAGLDSVRFRTWVTGCLLSAPFTDSVIRLQDLDASARVRVLADSYGLDLVEARRNMETVQNWLVFLTPGVI